MQQVNAQIAVPGGACLDGPPPFLRKALSTELQPDTIPAPTIPDAWIVLQRFTQHNVPKSLLNGTVIEISPPTQVYIGPT